MKYIARGPEGVGGYVEHYPESQRDVDFLVKQYGAKPPFECWCVANPPPAAEPWDAWAWTCWLREVERQKRSGNFQPIPWARG